MTYMKKKIQLYEREIIGNNFLHKGKSVRDDHHERILFLIENHLKFVKDSSAGWCVLYLNPDDKRYWEKYYPNGGYHGGGAPSLRHVNKERLSSEYGIGG